jgi:hypothetical protein
MALFEPELRNRNCGYQVFPTWTDRKASMWMRQCPAKTVREGHHWNLTGRRKSIKQRNYAREAVSSELGLDRLMPRKR